MISGNGTVVWSARYDSFGLATVGIETLLRQLVVLALGYDSFGLATVGIETVKNNLRFPGQYFDYETGLHYNWHRFYDPETGRYISADPIGLRGGMNLYTYVENNPVNNVDPEGLATYVGTEAHLIIAGGGVTKVTCCDETGKEWVHVYKKVCLGAALDGSAAGGTVSNSDGKSCSNPPKKLLGGEIGFGIPFVPVLGWEGGGAVDLGGSGLSGTIGGGGGVGPGKATACYYWLSKSQYTGKDCKCE
jgi:RHS repeat-associated protein